MRKEDDTTLFPAFLLPSPFYLRTLGAYSDRLGSPGEPSSRLTRGDDPGTRPHKQDDDVSQKEHRQPRLSDAPSVTNGVETRPQRCSRYPTWRQIRCSSSGIATQGRSRISSPSRKRDGGKVACFGRGGARGYKSRQAPTRPRSPHFAVITLAPDTISPSSEPSPVSQLPAPHHAYLHRTWIQSPCTQRRLYRSSRLLMYSLHRSHARGTPRPSRSSSTPAPSPLPARHV